MKTLPNLIIACGCLVAANCSAGTIYELVNYPELQNGYTLSGTIEVADTAADDGVLAVEEILDWSWVADGPISYSGRFRLNPDVNPTPIRATGVEIDSQGIYLPATEQPSLILEDAFVPDGSSLLEFRRVSWIASERWFTYLLTGINEGDIGFTGWLSNVPVDSPGSRWLIADRVPEPNTATITGWVLMIIVIYGASRKGYKHTS